MRENAKLMVKELADSGRNKCRSSGTRGQKQAQWKRLRSKWDKQPTGASG